MIKVLIFTAISSLSPREITAKMENFIERSHTKAMYLKKAKNNKHLNSWNGIRKRNIKLT